MHNFFKELSKEIKKIVTLYNYNIQIVTFLTKQNKTETRQRQASAEYFLFYITLVHKSERHR